MKGFIRRVVWGSVWIVSYAIIVYLSIELSDSQPVMLALLLLAAFVASVGLVYSRQSFRGGDWTVGSAALFVTAIALTVATIGDISYWSGTLETVHEQVTRDRAISDGQNLVRERQRERYSALSKGQSADALQAQMAAELARPIAGKSLGARTSNCTDTTSPHHKSCGAYFELKSRYHAAHEAQKLESVVWSAGTNVEGPGRRRDFYRAAIAISDATGWKVENSILAITAAIVVLLQALLMLSLYIAASPQRKAQTVNKAAWDDDVAPRAASSTPQPRDERSSRDVLKEALAMMPERRVISEGAFTSHDDGTGIWTQVKAEPKEEKPAPSFPKPELVKPVPVPVDEPREAVQPAHHLALVVDNDEPDFPPKNKKGRSKKNRKREDGLVKHWLADCTSQTEDRSVKATSKACRSSYVAWCNMNGHHPLSKALLSRQIGVLLGRATGKNTPRVRNNDGCVFPGLKVYQPVAASEGRRRANG